MNYQDLKITFHIILNNIEDRAHHGYTFFKKRCWELMQDPIHPNNKARLYRNYIYEDDSIILNDVKLLSHVMTIPEYKLFKKHINKALFSKFLMPIGQIEDYTEITNLCNDIDPSSVMILIHCKN